ncbi:hypothetical protein [Tenacibaculum maritimum]|uniref:hypothetical protein n=1 Tax=Tenacibaculum maritimum TaxID=107401 RepID=UPI0038904E66
MLKLFNKEASLKKEVKVMATDLDALCLEQYGKLTEAAVRELVVDKKWLASLQATLQTEMDAISQRLTSRIQELAARYEHTLTELDGTTNMLENKVSEHLKTMGLVWS